VAENNVKKDNNTQQKSYSYWSMVWRRFRRHKPAVISLILLVTIFLFSFLGGLVWRVPPDETIPYRDVFKDVISRTEKLPYFGKLNEQIISYAEVSMDDKLMPLLSSAPELQKPIENGALPMGVVFHWFKQFTDDAEKMAAQANSYNESGKEMESVFSPYLSVLSVIGNEITVYNQLKSSVYDLSHDGQTFSEIILNMSADDLDAGGKQFIVSTINNLLTIVHSSITFYVKDISLPSGYDSDLKSVQNSGDIQKAKDIIANVEDKLKAYNNYLEKQNLYLSSLQKAYDFIDRAFTYRIAEKQATLVDQYKREKGMYSEAGCAFENPCEFCQGDNENTLCDVPQGEGCTDNVSPKVCDEDALFTGSADKPAVCDLCGSLSSQLYDTNDFSSYDALKDPCVAKIFMESKWKGEYVEPITDVAKKISMYESFPGGVEDLKAPKNMPSLKDYNFVKQAYDEEIDRIGREISYMKKVKGGLSEAVKYSSGGKDNVIMKRKFAEKLREISGIDSEKDPLVKARIYSFIKDLAFQACDLEKDCKNVVEVLTNYIDSAVAQREKTIANIKADLKEYKSVLKDIDYYRDTVKKLEEQKPFEALFEALKPLAGDSNLMAIMEKDALPVYREMFKKVENDVRGNMDKMQYDKLILTDMRDFVDYWSQREFSLDKSYYPKFIVGLAQILIPNFESLLDEYLTENVPGYADMSYDEQEKVKNIYGAQYVKSILSSDEMAEKVFFGKGAKEACMAGNTTDISVKQMEAIWNSPLIERLRTIKAELGLSDNSDPSGCNIVSGLYYVYYTYNQFASFKSTVGSFGTELEFKAHTYGKLYYGYGKAWYDVGGVKADEIRSDLANLVEFPHLPMFSKGHPLGTDDKGRDVLARLIFGGQVSLLVGILTVIIAITVGTVIGITAGFYGGWWDNLSMRFVDIMMNIPSLPLLLALSQALRKFSNFFSETLHMGAIGGAMPIALVLALWSWMGLARLVRGQVLSVKEQQYVEAARAIGTPNSRIMFKHILPNVSAAIIVAATLQVGGAMLSEASLSFLGFGVQPPATSWGQMLQNATQIFQIPGYMYLVYLPGTFLFLTVLAFNFLGDGLRDALDPRMKL